LKKLIFYIIIFATVCIASDSLLKYSIKHEIDNQSPYYLSFASIGANLLESRLDCWAKIKTVSTNAEMDQALLKILLHMNLPGDTNNFLHQSNADALLTQYNLNYNNQNYLFSVQTNKIEDESYFLMTAINCQNDKQLQNDEKRLKTLLDCTSYYRYKGSIDIQPDYDGLEKLLQIVLKNLKADNYDIYRDGKVISMTGFSSILERENLAMVEIAGKKSNLQAAIRRNNKANTTEVYLGFPLLLNDY